MPFDDGLLDDQQSLARSDGVLRELAESGARVRRAAVNSEDSLREAVSRIQESRPRAIIAAGPDSRLLRAVLEQVCPVPFVAWPHAGLPGWAGSLDLVVVLAPVGDDETAARSVAEAVRRGIPLVVATPPESLVGRHAVGRYATVLPTHTRDQLATAVVMLELLDRLSLGPDTDPEAVATALDAVAISCSPYRDLAVNPAKIIASGIADTNPLVWGGTVLAARAARRIAESVRRATGRASLAADAEHLLPVLRAARPADVFADPFDEGEADMRPSLVVLDDGSGEPMVQETRDELARAADEHGVRVETITSIEGSEVARYASLLLTGTYAAEYLRLGRVDG